MEVVGYCEIRMNSTTGTSPVPMSKFEGQVCRVYEFTPEGNVMIMDSQATGMAIFNACDVHRKFECEIAGDVICPPNLTFVEKMIYATCCMTRNGGYCNILKLMVIHASLFKGKFCDSMLWAKNNVKPPIEY